MECPRCKNELKIDEPTKLWPCGKCLYAWTGGEIKAYHIGFKDGVRKGGNDK